MAIFVVQSASGGAEATSLTVTLGQPVTAGNTICASVGVFDGDTGSFTVAMTLGSSPDNWYLHRHYTRPSGSQNSYAAVWADANCAGGASTVTVTLSGATGGLFTGISMQVWEVSGLAGAAEDTTGAGGGNSSTWDTGSFSPTARTTAADEFWFACLSIANGSLTITGPSGWQNTTITSAEGSAMMAGYQITTATGTPDYSGTLSSNGQFAVVGVTLKAGSASGTAALSGHGTLTARAGPGASAALSGTGTLAAAGTGAAPDTAPLAGTGTLAAAGTTTVSGAAALAGSGKLTGAGSPPTVIEVANQWAGTLAQNPVFGPSLPAMSDVVVPLTVARSVGGGSGIPTAGNWLFAVCGWRQPPGGGPVTISVSDDVHSYWRPTSPSDGTGLTRTAIWYQPNIGQVTNNPGWVYVSTNGYVAGMAVLVVEVSGIGTWDEVAGITTSYEASTQSMSLTIPL